MININTAYNFLESGYSLLTVGENKTPNTKWKKYQTEQPSQNEFQKNYNKPSTKGIGIITGFNNLEVIDVDTKVLPENEKSKFWKEYSNLLNDNIEDFKKKFVIYKTKSGGFHIIYRCKKIDGNKKIAISKHSKEALIETRGVGGYCFIYYDNPVNLTYFDVKEISEQDREILFSVSNLFDVTEPIEQQTDLPTFKDYNSKVNILDIINTEFSIVKKTPEKTFIKRIGAKSFHSGYLFERSNLLYLFSTGTIYPHEKPLSASDVYSWKFHNGDKTKTSSDLYSQGYGKRLTNPQPVTEKIIQKSISFPIEIFPELIQNLINDVSENTGFSKDFLGVSIMATIASTIGQSISLKVDNTWETTCIFWFAIVGDTGSKKSHPVKFALKPLSKIDIKNKVVYDNQMEDYEYYDSLSDASKKASEAVKKPKYKQFIVNDATIEALFHVHNINKRGILIYKDELLGWFNSMGQYKSGKSDEMEKFLALFDGDELKINRVSKEPLVMERTNINLLGTIQPSKISLIPKENGALHRFLFSNADKQIKRYNKNEVNMGYIEAYHKFINDLNGVIDDTIDTIVYEMDSECKDIFSKIDSMLCDKQEAENTDPLITQYCEKLKTYTPRFALLTYYMNAILDPDNVGFVEKKYMEFAEKLVGYFLNTAETLFFDNRAIYEAKELNKSLNGKTNSERIIELSNKKIKVALVAKEVGVSRAYVYKVLKSVN